MTTTLDSAALMEGGQSPGPLSAVPDPDLPRHLIRLAGPRGHYILKRHRLRERFERERDAYQSWVPALGDLAPRLVAADEQQMTLLLTAIDAVPAARLEPGSAAEARAHRAAGEALGNLHLAQPEQDPGPALSADLANRLRAWIERAGTLVTSGERSLLSSAADAIEATPMDTATCHLDYQPRNWLVRPDGRVAVIDFEHARPDARIRDLARLAHRHWAQNPALKGAFLDGYGRHLTAADELLLGEFAALEAVTAIVRGNERTDPELIRHGLAVLARLAKASRP
jgi:Ser/Thr protein kinase RdoA (MazF antagonist)